MKPHKIILSITVLILIIEVVIFVLLFNFNLLDTTLKMVSLIFGMVWLLCYPFGLYTCYCHIAKDDKKGIILEKLLSGFAFSDIFAIFVIPLLIAPIFLPDYILLIQEDYRKYKWVKETNQL